VEEVEEVEKVEEVKVTEVFKSTSSQGWSRRVLLADLRT
jgi:hypothetical protein